MVLFQTKNIIFALYVEPQIGMCNDTYAQNFMQ